MILYCILLLVFAGFLIRIDDEGIFDGWRGAFKFVMCLVCWPFVLGVVLGAFTIDEDKGAE